MSRLIFVLFLLFSSLLWAQNNPSPNKPVLECTAKIPNPSGFVSVTYQVMQNQTGYNGIIASPGEKAKHLPQLAFGDFDIRPKLASHKQTTSDPKALEALKLNFGETLILFAMLAEDNKLVTNVDLPAVNNVRVYRFMEPQGLPQFLIKSWDVNGAELGTYFSSLIVLPCE